ncbi:GIY-YIG nuclease family protein [Salegentibacter sp. BDJ18]|uniref:GIY-YIG nuclease family protein n=1 Tax=Salegentibacter sp. BDJ18 TaxID=2816376 RepID=UPI001AAE2B41|nr:GIY-YIG nuclease family protein [Salegentibacter sp. BDJ18]MBO2544418.1 GIY-YIG nuclease family protein [Salegentibacter sp. BDJ18]
MFGLFKTKENRSYITYEEDESGTVLIYFDNSNLKKIKGEYVYDENSAWNKFQEPQYNDEILNYNSIFEWTLHDNDFIEEGNSLFTVRKANNDFVKELLNEVYVLNPAESPKSGIIQIIKKEREILNNGDLICKILPNRADSNSPKNNSYTVRFNKYEIPPELRNLDSSTGKKHISLSKWLVENNTNVDFDQEIAQVKGGNAQSTYFSYNLKAKKSGIITIFKNDTSFLNNGLEQNEAIYVISDNQDIVFENTYFNRHIIENDDFEQTKTIKWKIVGGYKYPYNSDTPSPIGGIISNSDVGKDLIFSFENINNRDYLALYFFSKDYKLNIGDKVSFMFENQNILSFEIIEKPIKSNLNWKNLFETRILITQDELSVFSKDNLSKWKIDFASNNNSIIGVANNYYWYKNENYSKVLKNLVAEYIEIVNQNIENHIAFKNRENLKELKTFTDEKCSVYLMIDTTNNFHKIGISNKPKYREKTLQADKPTIELLCSKEFPNRKMAESIEKSLHITFDNKRIRGEWFELDAQEVKDIITTLK